jgi:hypothetical protein
METLTVLVVLLEEGTLLARSRGSQKSRYH